MSPSAEAFERLITIMNTLRAQCPWDRKQTIHTLRTLTIEELYELTDAILDTNWDGIQEEVGDVLLHLVFYCTIAQEQGKFTIPSMIHALCDKLVHRHPHIYSNVIATDEATVKLNWEKLKLKEGKTSVLQGVPKGLPSIVKAIRLQEKAKQVGFEWEHKHNVWAKVQEELEELQQAVISGNQAHIESELGDVLFSVINYARYVQVDADIALEKTNTKFAKRFTAMEALALSKGYTVDELTLTQLDELWNITKKDIPT